MNVFVKKKKVPSFGLFSWEYLQKRDYKVNEHEVFYSSYFILPNCFLERSNLGLEDLTGH